MTASLSIPRLRLANQLLAGTPAESPAAAVRRLGMVQAQEYRSALWALGLRSTAESEAAFEAAIERGEIVRSWPARGTLHFTAAEDLRWMLALLTPRVIALQARRYDQLGLVESDFERAREALFAALQGGRRLTRPEAYRAIQSAGVSTEGQRGIHILSRLAMEGLLCFGPHQGRQPTFVLLEEWLPPAPPRPREESLAELARRYFTGHGPAAVQDFAWWSGLTMVDARKAIQLAAPDLQPLDIGGQRFWLGAESLAAAEGDLQPLLLPAFDEYLVAYRDRSAVLDPHFTLRANAGGGLLNPTIVIGGQALGTWKRELTRSTVRVLPDWFEPPSPAQQNAFAAAAERYAGFLGLRLELPASGGVK